jgi:hypothetical protein
VNWLYTLLGHKKDDPQALGIPLLLQLKQYSARGFNLNHSTSLPVTGFPEEGSKKMVEMATFTAQPPLKAMTLFNG